MSKRAAEITAFLSSSPWQNWNRSKLAGDASSRRYERLTDPKGERSVILMDAPTDRGEDVTPFVKIATHLQKNGLKAPDILAKNSEDGLLIIEDLGDALFARILETDAQGELGLYRAAVDVLLELRGCDAPAHTAHYSPDVMCDQASLCFDWYAQRPDLQQQFAALIKPLLEGIWSQGTVLTLRDYHAENLIWRPDRSGLQRVGLLDFQDAVICHPAYDLMSLLRDARRDVSVETRDAMVLYYIEKSKMDEMTFRRACALLCVQRQLRILFIFTRLCLGFGKPQYLDLIPRVWDHLIEELAHPALDQLRAFLLKALPEPTPQILSDLRDRCSTRPVL